MGPDMNSS